MILFLYEPIDFYIYKDYIESIQQVVALQAIPNNAPRLMDLLNQVNEKTHVILLPFKKELYSLNPFLQYYILNIEQVTIETYKNLYTDLFKSYPSIQLLDYSLENIKQFQHPLHHHLPYIIQPRINTFCSKPIDILFFGCISDRRMKVVNELKGKGLNVVVESYVFGDRREQLIRSSKVILNIHFREDYQITEVLRLYPCIQQKALVISETSPNYDLEPLKKYILFCEYKQLVQTCLDTLNNYDKVYFDIYKDDSDLLKQIEKDKQKIINLFK